MPHDPIVATAGTEECPHSHVIEQVRYDVHEIKDIVCGPRKQPEQGMQYQVYELRKQAKASHRVLWIIAGVAITFVAMRVAEKLFPADAQPPHSHVEASR